MFFHRIQACCLTAVLLAGCAATHERCEGLAGLKFDDAQVLSARAYRAGQRPSLQGAFFGAPLIPLPASCRVELQLTPSDDSDIRAEVWMPLENWNGRFQGIGNGGFAGSIETMSLMVALQRGYAAASTDTGHDAGGEDGEWAYRHPEKVRDYGYRAVHEMTVKAKAVTTAFYGKAPEYSYFGSCSNGGRAGLIEAQRYPDDYDGILAGAPALHPSNTIPAWAWLQQQMERTRGARLSKRKLETIAAAVVEACDTKDGVADGVLEDPRSCHFDPHSLLCKAGDADDCLTAPQVQTLKNIYAGPTGDAGDPGYEPGGEVGDFGDWSEWFSGSWFRKSLEHIYAIEFYRYLVHDNPDWTLDDFEFERDRRDFERVLGPVLDATDPDLSAFQARGGKLILYHGWNDPALQPRLTIDYYERVQQTLGAEKTDDSVRLYMVPGLQHCAGGPGPNIIGQLPPGGDADPGHHMAAALEAWVEKGAAPGPMIATKYDHDIRPLLAPEKSTVIRTRTLCPYPQVARWTGKGSTDDAANFVCTSP